MSPFSNQVECGNESGHCVVKSPDQLMHSSQWPSYKTCASVFVNVIVIVSSVMILIINPIAILDSGKAVLPQNSLQNYSLHPGLRMLLFCWKD